VDRGPCVIQEHWFCGSASRSAWYWSCGCVVIERGTLVVLEQWLCDCASRSEHGTRAVAVW
jgi:hypothetical protein